MFSTASRGWQNSEERSKPVSNRKVFDLYISARESGIALLVCGEWWSFEKSDENCAARRKILRTRVQ